MFLWLMIAILVAVSLCGWLYLSHKKNISFWLYKKAFKG